MSNKKNFDYKDVVGKLMSEENISIVHSKGSSTASFDISKRILYLPEFIDVSEDVYDLLIGHEVSHALHTPEKGWHNATEDRGANFKTFLNVVEDARIEKMIQKKFPGLKASFKRGYKDLFNMDLFGIKDKSKKEIDDMLLIDRLNLYFKLGQLQSGVSFKKEEMQYVEEMDNLKTWKDVVELAEKLFEYCKEEQKEKQQEQGEGDPSSKTGFSEDINSDPSDLEMDESPSTEQEQKSPQNSSSDSKDQDGKKSDSQGLDGSDSGNQDQSNKPESQSSESDSASGKGNIDEDEPYSLTDKNFRDNEKSLNSDKEENRWSRETSEDLPILKEDIFYDDWKKVYSDVTKWRENAMKNGW